MHIKCTKDWPDEDRTTPYKKTATKTTKFRTLSPSPGNIYTTAHSSQNIQIEELGSTTMVHQLSLIHISEPTRPERISYAVFCLKKKKKKEKKKETKRRTTCSTPVHIQSQPHDHQRNALHIKCTTRWPDEDRTTPSKKTRTKMRKFRTLSPTLGNSYLTTHSSQNIQIEEPGSSTKDTAII